MKKLLALLIVGLAWTMITGCATLSETSKERSVRMKKDRAREWKMAVEDWDRFWLIDRSTRLSPNNM